MPFSDGKTNIMDIIQLILPVVTFAMGYFLTGIAHKRDTKIRIMREKFEKLYHPFFVMVNELGTETEEGFAFSVKDREVLKQFFDHFSKNMYLATSDGQRIFWETRSLFFRCTAEGDALNAEQERLFDESMSELFGYLLQEYVKNANALGYDLGDAETRADAAEVRD